MITAHDGASRCDCDSCTRQDPSRGAGSFRLRYGTTTYTMHVAREDVFARSQQAFCGARVGAGVGGVGPTTGRFCRKCVHPNQVAIARSIAFAFAFVTVNPRTGEMAS